MRDRATLLTQGPVGWTLVRFALPLLFGNLFQQMYNAVDSLIVGNFIGTDALAAVSSSSRLINMTISLLQGMFIGAGVVIARHFGAKHMDLLRRAIHTTVTFALLAGAAVSVLGVYFSPAILRLMGTPDSVMPNSTLYFRIYYSGLLSVVLYNCANGILQAVGDSRHPLYYLIFSSMLNVALDLLFVVGFGLGVGGVACATVISQASSAAMAFFHLSHVNPEYRFSPRQMGIDPSILLSILRTGIPTGLQNSIVSFSNVLVQSHINSFGAASMAGSGTFLKLEGFAFMPITSFALASTTFVSQNMGAQLYERTHKGVLTALKISFCGGLTLAALLHFMSPHLIRLFSDDPEVIWFGVTQAHIVSFFYFLPALTHCMAGVLRGMGRAVVPMATLIVCWCGVRVLWLSIVLRIWHDPRLLYAVYPLTWFLSTAVLLCYYRGIDWEHCSL